MPLYGGELGPYVYYRVPLRTYLVSRGVFVAVGRRLLVTSGLWAGSEPRLKWFEKSGGGRWVQSC